MAAALVFVALLCLSANVHQSESQNQDLATKINCETDEVRHYKYNSIVNLWGEIDGRISVKADLAITCLGTNTGGNFGSEALKYRAEISNLQIEENQSREDVLPKRRKRGIGSFFSNAWRKVKNFFITLFGGTPEEDRQYPKEPEIQERDQSSPVPEFETTTPKVDQEEEEESYDYGSLYREPFEFVQMPNGSIPEILFTEAEEDNRVRNFKRHLVDAFASQLSLKPQHSVVVETSVMGEHLSNYNISVGGVTAALSGIEGEDDRYNRPLADNGESTVVVKKLVTQDDILDFAPTSENMALNDMDKMELKARQTQIFSSGKLVSTSGSSSLLLFEESAKKRRSKRRADEDVMAYFQVHSSFEIQFSGRQRRSVDNYLSARRGDKDLVFSSAGRPAELEDSSSKQRLYELQRSIGDTKKFVEAFIQHTDEDDDEKMQIMFEVVQQEVRYGIDNEPQSLANEIRKSITEEVLAKICFAKVKRCIDLLQLFARAGGQEAENALLSYVVDESTSLSYRREIADLLSDLSNPTPNIIDSLVKILTENNFDSSLLGSVAISASNLAIIAKEEQKKLLVNSLIKLLDASWSPDQSDTNHLTLDVLESIGNIGDPATLEKVLQVCWGSPNKAEVHIACAHSMRFLSHLPSVQAWMKQMIIDDTCDVTHAIIGSLLDKIHKQEMSGDDRNWPRKGFNSIDRLLKQKVEKTPADAACSSIEVSVLRYFRRKKNPEAEEFADNYFSGDTEAFEPGSKHRQKRALWDDINCSEWTEDDKYTPIQDKDEFALDMIKYNKRKSCLATRKLGLKGASSDIYAGMFAGVKQPSDPPKYKLFTKFVSGVNFLGRDMEIGSFYFYHTSGNTKAYVRILGKTRQEFQHTGCTPTELRYRPITHIPLYQVRISLVQLSLGIHLSSELQLETLCPKENMYDFKPLSDVRIGGEAMGTVLFVRGAMNLGGSFNYFLQFTFDPTPDMCLSGQHGFNPMTVSVEAYYQFWNAAKLRWGKSRSWKPISLMWEVNDGNKELWFNDTCVLKDVPEDITTTKAPEIKEENPVAVTFPNYDNDVLVVRT